MRSRIEYIRQVPEGKCCINHRSLKPFVLAVYFEDSTVCQLRNSDHLEKGGYPKRNDE